jgi:hypothetical protein
VAASGALGGIAVPNRYEQVPGAYVDLSETPEARQTRAFERQQTAAQASADRAEKVRLFLADQQARAQAAALEGQNRRADATLAETARHNRASEGTAATMAATAAERAAHPGGNRPLPAAVTQGIVTNNVALQQIDNAIQQIRDHPGAMGMSNALGGSFLKDQFSPDPANIAARATVANLSSMQIHNRTGAAMSKTEWERLRPFLPTDVDNPTTAITKLQGLRRQVELETTQMQTLYGARVPEGAFPAAADVPDAAKPAAGTPPGWRGAAPATGAATHPVVRKYGITPP